MRSRTPIATPVVPPPKLKPDLERLASEQRAPLVAPVSIVTPVGEFELPQGALLVGRLPECTVCLDDPLVSRMHVRIIVQGECVIVEDLHSANGVYLNGVRVASTAVLREGDRILIGTSELSLFEVRDSSTMKAAVAPASARQEPPHQRAPFQLEARPSLSTERQQRTERPGLPRAQPWSAGPTPSKLPASFDRVPSTARASALKMIGVLADRLAADGDLEEAGDVVTGQLRRILQGANTGLSVTLDVAALASHYALKVARWTGQALWVDYVVELHLSGGLLMSASTLEEFSRESARVATYDRLLLAYYVEAMQGRSKDCSPEELARIELLACFCGRP